MSRADWRQFGSTGTGLQARLDQALADYMEEDDNTVNLVIFGCKLYELQGEEVSSKGTFEALVRTTAHKLGPIMGDEHLWLCMMGSPNDMKDVVKFVAVDSAKVRKSKAWTMPPPGQCLVHRQRLTTSIAMHEVGSTRPVIELGPIELVVDGLSPSLTIALEASLQKWN